jgi:enoyl-CoA hydratase/carnithine racemase
MRTTEPAPAVRSRTENGICHIDLGNGGADLSPEALAAAYDALDEFERDPAGRVAVLSGGRGDFGVSPVGAVQIRPQKPATVKPVVAAVNGRCWGEALILLCRTTVQRVAGDDASFCFGSEVPAVPNLVRRAGLRDQLPYAAAMWLTCARGTADARRALQMGLVSEVVPVGSVLDRAREIAHRLVQLRPAALRSDRECAELLLHQPRENGIFLSYVDYVLSYHEPTADSEGWALHAQLKGKD